MARSRAPSPRRYCCWSRPGWFGCIGAAAIAPTSLALIVRAWPHAAEQQRAVGRWAGVGGLGLVVGPVLGGALTSGFGWSSVFMVTAVLTLLILVTAQSIEEDSTRDDRPIDFPGIVLGSIVLAMAVTWIIEVAAWGLLSLRSLLVAVMVVVSGALFVARERRTSHPMLPIHVFTSMRFMTVNTATVLMTFGNTGFLFVYALFLQADRGFSPLVAGLHLMPMSIGVLGGSLLSHRLTARAGLTRTARLGFIAEMLMMAVLLIGGPGIAPVVQVPALLVIGLGCGWEISSVVAITVRLLPPRDAGLASGITNTSRQLGTALGTAAIGSLYGPGGWSRFVIAIVGVIIAFGLAWGSLRVRPGEGS